MLFGCKKLLLVLTAALLLITTAAYAGTSYYYYDPIGRLLAVSDDTGDVYKYHYDAAGNRLKSGVYFISIGVFDPAGKVWTFDTDGDFTSSSADDTFSFIDPIDFPLITTTHPVTGDWEACIQT